MRESTALPMPASARCNFRVLQGKELAAAIRAAIELKSAKVGAGKVGPTALGNALGIKQPSASELLTTGRLSKEKLPKLLDYFEDVVGPDHFGLPFSRLEAEVVKYLRGIPLSAQERLRDDLKAAAERASAATSTLGVQAAEPEKPSRKRPKAA